MTILQKTTYLFLAMAAIVALPCLGNWINLEWHTGHSFPPGFFNYPMLSAPAKAPFSPMVFGIIAIAGLVVVAAYVFPSWFGFKKVEQAPSKPVVKVNYPLWGWIGLISWGLAMVLLAMKSTRPAWLLHWSDVPLFWGFTLMIDGWVYMRNGGKSLMSQVPQEIVGIGVASVSGWMIFEYLNFFVDDDWYYPRGNIVSQEQFLLYAIIISSGLLPLAFEWYSLFTTFRTFRKRFSNGIKLVLPQSWKPVLIVLSLIGLFIAGLWPNIFFFSLWVTPAMLLMLVLDKNGVWTPLTPIGKGNWTPTLLFALTYLVEGVCLEGQNYFSAIHYADGSVWTEAPAYWQYSLPYVNEPHVFEMPLLGLLGYLPFGVYCWVWWIGWASMMGVPSKFFMEEPFEPNTIN